MKFYVTMKNPDALKYAIEDAVAGMTADEKEEHTVAMNETADMYMDDDEYIIVEFDTETKSAIVMPL